MNNPAPPLKVTKAQLMTLERISKSRTAPHRLVIRSKVLLLASQGIANTTIAKDLDVGISTVRAYCRKLFKVADRIIQSSRGNI